MAVAKQYSYASDLWALGVIIFQLLTNEMPFKGKTQELTFEQIKKGDFTIPEFVDESAKDLIKKLLVVCPSARLGAQNIDELMSHPFFSGIDFSTIKDQTPPASQNISFELTEAQKKQKNFLPKNIKKNQVRKQDSTPKALKPLFFANVDTEDLSPCPRGKQFGELSPLQLNKCFSATPGQSNHNLSQDDIIDSHSMSSVSDLSPSKPGEGVGTPKFDDRTATAVFGSFQEMSQAVCQNKEASLTKDRIEVPEIVLKTFAGKKSRMIYYTQRELILFSNGSFAYKRKNKSEKTKQTITRADIVKISRNKHFLQININNCSSDANQESTL